ncbi:MAG TPA: hypothetical protein VH572_11240 [Gaiella sp.]|jgi:hypothetical protein
MTSADEGRALARSTAKRIAGLSWEELDAYGQRVERVESSTGQPFRVVTTAFWDMDDWASDMLIVARVYAERGWRRWRPWRAVEVRGGEGLRLSGSRSGA